MVPGSRVETPRIGRSLYGYWCIQSMRTTARHLTPISDVLSRTASLLLNVFSASKGESYDLELEQPVTIRLATPLSVLPPSPPPGGNTPSVMWWSLKLRYWVWKVERQQSQPQADIKVFVLYHDPKLVSSLPHSLGLQKGLIGVVHAFSSAHMSESNNVVIAHEIMHTVGASDKYDTKSGQPIYPDGYAEPKLKPRYPQSKAEIMGGRIPVTEKEASIPRNLSQTTVGQRTALEIGWLTSD